MKKITAILAALALILSLAACGKEPEPSQTTEPAYTVDVNALAENIISSVEFSEKLENLSPDYAYKNYGLEDIRPEISAWGSSGAVVDCLAVFNAKDSNEVALIQSAVESTIDYLRDGYTDYGPDQVPKIDSAVVLTNGNCVVFCIAKDNNSAKDVIDHLMKSN